MISVANGAYLERYTEGVKKKLAHVYEDRRMKRVVALMMMMLGPAAAWSQSLPAFDLTRPDEARQWHPQHHIAALEPSAEGLVVRINGTDPYFVGPARDYPSNELLWMDIRLRSDEPGMLQVFYFPRGQGPAEKHSVRAAVAGGEWQDVRISVPALGPGYHLRIDPPGSRGQVTIASIRFEVRPQLKAPAWPRPTRPALDAASPVVRSAQITLAHSTDKLGAFTVAIGGKEVACGFNRPLIGYVLGNDLRWIDVNAIGRTTAAQRDGSCEVESLVKDPDGATWRLVQRFAPGRLETIDVRTQVTVDRDRQVLFLPLLVLTPGAGSFGTSKTQAIFPGLEYLDRDEPSSSEADIIGPGSRRQVPDTLKITIPVMTILAEGRYVALAWQMRQDLAAVFDSPDRLFSSGGHVMGVIYPGSDGAMREEGNLMPYVPGKLAANVPLTLRATIMAGEAENALEPIRRHIALHGLPPVPDTKMNLAQYARLAAAGWLDSKIRDGSRYRHAFPGEFQPHPAADAAWMMHWLAGRVDDVATAKRLQEASAAAIGEVPSARYSFTAVGHVRYPVASLLYGHVAENIAVARQAARGALSRFEADGRILYKAGKVDYGKTHFAPDANGLTAPVVAGLLENALFCGDAKLIQEGLRLLRGLDRYANSAPRGAQTWECPLHTPDILASAYLVKAYTLGYQVSGDPHLLEMARDWAWSGVPFVYLVPPTARSVGPYATIAVFGATNWEAPNWMGLPVQWCGLVYAETLYVLSEFDQSGPWKQIADGIAASGIQQTFPLGSDPDRVGLLPDSYALRTGVRNDPAINPGTVQAPAMRLYRQSPAYDLHVFREAAVFVHAPGAIVDAKHQPGGVRFAVRGCSQGTYRVLISGCKARPRVGLNGNAAAPDAVEYVEEGGCVIVRCSGDATVELTW